MKASTAIVLSMFLTEIGTNAHVLLPPALISEQVVSGVITQIYAEPVVDPWTVRMVSLSLASAFMLILFTLISPDKSARNYMRAWALFFVSQGVQKMCGMNVAESISVAFSGGRFDLLYDLAIMLAFILSAWAVNKLGLEVKYPNLRVEWSRHR